MEKKIPKVFKGSVKTNGNNEKIYYSNENNKKNIKDNKPNEHLNINQKIKNIFNSSDYIYKADVEIKLKNGWTKKRIVGRNSTHLITMENELIPLSDVLDIKKN